MRITGGSVRGRRLASPKTGTIRPTSDRVREALFNILGARVAGGTVLDLFAGTGALGIEALSRGAAFALFVDQSREAGRLIEANLRTCFPQPAAAFLQLNLTATAAFPSLPARIPAGLRFDLVFMDPPYQKNLAQHALAMVEQAGILAPDALVVVEEHRLVQLPEHLGELQVTDQRRYGETGLWFYQRPPA